MRHPKRICYYHGGCADGFASAYVLYMKYSNMEFVPSYHNGGVPNPSEYKDKEVYIVDFAFPLKEMQTMAKKAKNLYWYDHHKSSFEMLGRSVDENILETQGNFKLVLTNALSGVGITWFQTFGEKPMPDLLKDIQDRDLWKLKRPNSKAVGEALYANRPWSFDQFINLSDPEVYMSLVEEGEELIYMRDKEITEAMKDLVPISLHGEPALSLNTHRNISALGNAIAEKHGCIAFMWTYKGPVDGVLCSMRSIGDIDVSIIATRMGGGGHKNAAGFNCELWELINLIGEKEGQISTLIGEKEA